LYNKLSKSSFKKIVKFQPTEEDVVAHKKAVKEIKEAVWKKYNY